MSSDWLSFFTTIAQISVGLAGLLFISFSIYLAGFQLDQFEITIGTLYYLEVVAAFIISLSAILPPHWWWIGAVVVVSLYAYHIVKAEKDINEYSDKGKMNDFYEVQTKTRFILWIRTLILFIDAILGFSLQLNIQPVIFKIDLSFIVLPLVGLLIELYLISCVIGSWFFLLNFNRQKHK